MKRRIIPVIALLAVMVAMIGAASAGEITLIDTSTGNKVSNPIEHVVPGQDFHLQTVLALDAGNVANGATYVYHVIVTPLFGGGKASDITIHRGASHTVLLDGQTVKPNSPNFIDPEEIHWEISKDAPFDAQYNVLITFDTVNPQPPTTRMDPQSASKNLIIISPNTTLKKTANPTTVTVNQPVTYTYEETNTGDVNLTNVNVVDDALTVTPVNQPAPNQAFNIGDVNRDGLLNPKETWTFTSTTSFPTPGTFTNIAHGHGNPIVNGTIFKDIDITDPKFPTEKASATVTVNVSCPTGDCKFKTWGLLGNVADPEKKFEMLFFSPIPNGGPQGSMTVEDNKLGMTIESTQVTSIVTSIPAGTGTATGRAHVTGGPHPGDYDFTVNVVDAAHSKTPRGTFELILTGFPGGYDNKGPLTFGAISIIK